MLHVPIGDKQIPTTAALALVGIDPGVILAVPDTASGSSSRLRHRPALIFPQQIVGRLDHQGLDGRILVKGELPLVLSLTLPSAVHQSLSHLFRHPDETPHHNP